MRKWIILGMSILGTLSLTASATNSTLRNNSNNIQSDEITAIINKDTSEKELDDLKAFFYDNGIELIIKKIEYNQNNELTSLSIILKKGNSKSQYSSSSNTPISKLELGYKNGGLFITNSGISGTNILNNLSHFSYPNIDMDSIMKKHGLAFNFNFEEENDSILGSHFDIHKLKDQFMQSFNFEEDENGNLVFGGKQMQPFQNQRSQKYSFVDNPNIEKLIIIDGKEANFETLDDLANSDQLAEVDFLKPITAISIYGDKAKDGAIIAITKK
ncbi:hypothetical protein [Aquimarina pacifica]|uniref:hypothetical protein n=1 Tax=Aquimarina pacifica TaxID=1296415 RepID=UPI000471D4A2|nr:hypothetical protein [Aquimarina pacifica]